MYALDIQRWEQEEIPAWIDRTLHHPLIPHLHSGSHINQNSHITSWWSLWPLLWAHTPGQTRNMFVDLAPEKYLWFLWEAFPSERAKIKPHVSLGLLYTWSPRVRLPSPSKAESDYNTASKGTSSLLLFCQVNAMSGHQENSASSSKLTISFSLPRECVVPN